MAGEALAAAETRGWLYHPKYPQHWNRRPLYDLAQWVNGLAFRDIQFSATGLPVIKIAEIKGGISPQTKFTEQTFDESVRVRNGDLLFSWSGQPETSIDAFWWRGPEGWLNQHVFRVTPAEDIDATFFYYLLRYLKPNFIGIARNKQTIGLGHVTKRDLDNIERREGGEQGMTSAREKALRDCNAKAGKMSQSTWGDDANRGAPNLHDGAGAMQE